MTVKRHQNGIRAGREIAVAAIYDQLRKDAKTHDDYTLVPAALELAGLALSQTKPDTVEYVRAMRRYAEAQAQSSLFERVVSFLSDSRRIELAVNELLKRDSYLTSATTNPDYYS